jgi:adenylate kinase
MSKGQFILDTDASGVGNGTVLWQVQNNKERVISYCSKKLDKQQQRYSATRRELLAVVTFIHQFRHYLLGNKFLLRTDHGS